MQDKSKFFVHGLMCIGQAEYGFVIKYNEELLKYLKSGKNIRVKDLMVFEPKEGEPKDE